LELLDSKLNRIQLATKLLVSEKFDWGMRLSLNAFTMNCLSMYQSDLKLINFVIKFVRIRDFRH